MGPFFNGAVFGGGFFGGTVTTPVRYDGKRPKSDIEKKRKDEEELMAMLMICIPMLDN